MRKAIFLAIAMATASLGVAHSDESLPEIQGTLRTPLSSAIARVGDPVIVANLQCTGLSSAGFPDGSCTGGQLTGQVTKVQKAGQGVHAQLEVQFHSLDIRTSNGRKTIVALFQIEQLGPNKNTGRETTGALAGAAAGALFGKLMGHSTAEVIAGAAAGAAGGFLLETNNRQDIQIAQDQVVKVLLKTVRRIQSR